MMYTQTNEINVNTVAQQTVDFLEQTRGKKVGQLILEFQEITPFRLEFVLLHSKHGSV